MQRVIVPIVFATALLLGMMQGAPSRSAAVAGAAMLQSTPTPTPPAEHNCADPSAAAWEPVIEVRPSAAAAAVITPRDATTGQVLYLATWTVPPGICVPYEAKGNQKNGAVILMVQQGNVDFTWQPYGDDPAAEVNWGHVSDIDATPLGSGVPQRLIPGDWVSMDDQVWFTYTSVGDENAIVLKAVWADLGPDHGCGGSCK